MTARMDKARRISNVLAGLDAAGVRTLIDGAEPVGVGIGGTSKTARINGTTVFVKQLPLTVLEGADPAATASRVQLQHIGGADLIAQHANVAVYVTEMFGILLRDATATRYSSAHAAVVP